MNTISRFSMVIALACGIRLLAAEPPLLNNPSAKGEAGKPAPTAWRVFSTDGRYEHAVDTTVYHSPPSSGRIRGFSGTGRACFSTLGMRVITVEPYYRLSFWYRCGRKARLHGFVRFKDAAKPDPTGNGFHMFRFYMEGKPDVWTQFDRNFEVPEERRAAHPKARVELTLYGDPGGTAWFDDLEFELGQPPPPPPPDPLRTPITELKDLQLKTPLAYDGAATAVIVPSSHAHGRAAARALAEQIQKQIGVLLPIREDVTDDEILRMSHVIAVGNMPTSPFIEFLYRRHYTYLDRHYPGKNGHVVRTVHNPFGHGHNVVLLGGSDDRGVDKAVGVFLAKLTASPDGVLGWTMDIGLGEGMVPPKPGERVKAWSEFEAKPGYFGWNPISKDFALYFMTADPAYLDDVRKLVFPKGDTTDPRLVDGDRMVEDPRRPLREAYHYKCHITPLTWDLVEESPEFTDEERLYITNELRLQQAKLNTGTPAAFSKNGRLPDRHAIHEILSIWSGSRYFAYSYPDIVWSERMMLACKGFELNYQTPASSTPRIQTGTVMWPLQELAIYAGLDDYFAPGGVFEARLRKWMSVGEEVVKHQWNYTMLRSAAHLLRDGGVLSLVPNPGEQSFRVGQAYAGDLEPKPLGATCGLQAFPLFAPRYNDTHMGPVLDEAIEFVIYRSSMEEARKQHLMLYGYYEGSKSRPRVNSILNYQQNGVRLLARGSTNELQILRGGLREHGPAHGAALKAVADFGACAYSRTTVPDHDFCVWDRSLFIFRDEALVVFDRATMGEAGDFEITLPWSIGTSANVQADGCRWTAGERQCAVVGADACSSGPRSVRFSRRKQLQAGDEETFFSLLTSVPGDGPPPRITRLAANVAAVQASSRAVVAVGAFATDGLSATAEACVFGEAHWRMIQGTELNASGVRLQATAPVDAEVDIAGGTLQVTARDRVATVTVSGGAVGTLTCPAGETVIIPLTGIDGVAIAACLRALVQRALEQKTDTVDVADEGVKTASFGISWQAQLDGEITGLLTTVDGRVLAGSSTGEIGCFDVKGKQLWQFRARAAVYALAAGAIGGEPVFLAGSDDEHLYAFDQDGTLRWQAKAQVSQWMAHHHSYWTMGNKAKVRKILITDIDGDAKTDIFLGTGGSAVERFDETGRSLWLTTYHYGTPSSLLAVDAVSGHAGLELVAGAFSSSYDSTVRVLDPASGNVLRTFGGRYPSDTPDLLKHRPNAFSQGNAFLHRVVLSEDVNGILRILCGSNWNQICMNDAVSGKALWCRDIGSGGSRSKLGEHIPGVALSDLDADGIADAVAGFGNGWVTALSGRDGSQLWATRLIRPVCSFSGTPADGAFLAGCDDGTWIQLDASGTVTHQRQLAGRPTLCARLQDVSVSAGQWIAADKRGRLVALQPGVPDARWSYGLPTMPLALRCQADGRKPEPLMLAAAANGTFVGAVPAPAKAWMITPPADAKIALLDDRGATVEHNGVTLLLHGLGTTRWGLINGNQLRIESDVAGPLIVAVESGPFPSGYSSRVLPAEERWETVRTDGAEFVIYQNEVVYFKPELAGQWFETDRLVSAAGDYELWAEFYCSGHRGICDVFLDGKLMCRNLDLYRSKRVFWTEPMRLGRATLKAGKHTIRFVLRGKRPEAKAQILSVRSVVLIPATWDTRPSCRVESGKHGLGVTWSQGTNTFRAFFRGGGAGTASWDGLITDAAACSVVTDQNGPIYHEVRKGTTLQWQGTPLVELAEPNSVRSLPRLD
ncbi:MAG: PQQ-binding-like beta-propeller repeat protein [Lentisphaerae bacterium]|nr:PQQ-binding-like beta-propeller repeat protein [Lentisphaerota bacterium]MBT4820862.1 PQQ-binding-like beta-propeller repeat protein [Lentisphaerota bacterium]MBT5607300.1 PQQ-binding-like beta-propeller repeat protein [Lentisphaerota bacterium]MBT7055382.1 PQQ-binding-like beta-propeller repeat protein [Lentisphaerota bacterium]MBT7840980.1 PQQ-binding-like beta-propeller repeat protein [Lentisphaerota bacterium]